MNRSLFRLLHLSRAFSSASMLPPVCPTVPKTLTYHNRSMPDPYYWLRDDSRTNEKVLSYLKQENEYARANLYEPLKSLTKQVYDEFVGRLKEDDDEVPVKRGPYEYYKKTVKGKQYAIYCRRNASAGGQEEALLDLNSPEFSEHKFLNVASFKVSPDHSKVAYSLDTSGAESYSVHVRDLVTKSTVKLPLTLDKSAYSLEWDAASQTIYFDRHDEIMRAYQVAQYRLGADTYEIIYTEPDKKFEVSFSKSGSGKYILILSKSSLTSEITVLNAETNRLEGALAPRTFKEKYTAEHVGNYFYILSNKQDQTNYALYRTRLGTGTWETVLPYDASQSLEELVAFRDFLVLVVRSNALVRFRVFPANAAGELDVPAAFEVPLTEAVYAVNVREDAQVHDSNVLRYGISSLVHPESTVDFDLATRQATVRKVKEVLMGYNPEDYVIERHTAMNKGVPVPISLAYRRDRFVKKRPEGNPCLLYGYGSYGISIDPGFKQTWASYLNRGIVVAIAHIRGGGDCGKTHYEDGKFLRKRNTFEDFVAAADYLVEAGYADPKHLAIEGRSAGGLLMGAVVNMRPELFHVVLAGVPFVDVINTMMDETIPLTVNEYEEWGNPNELEYFDYMVSYSPYDNLPKSATVQLPNMLVRGGLHDPRVQYWEPAKYVAKLRASPLQKRDLFLLMEMGSGHFGSSGRYAYYEYLSIEYAFVISKIALY